MSDLKFVKVSEILQWGESVKKIVHKNNPKTTKIIEGHLYVRQDVTALVCPEIARMSKGEILRKKLTENKKEKK